MMFTRHLGDFQLMIQGETRSQKTLFMQLISEFLEVSFAARSSASIAACPYAASLVAGGVASRGPGTGSYAYSAGSAARYAYRYAPRYTARYTTGTARAASTNAYGSRSTRSTTGTGTGSTAYSTGSTAYTTGASLAIFVSATYAAAYEYGSLACSRTAASGGISVGAAAA
nr:hypothetical protein Q903MT_gene761 [Picea sitchensis]